MFAGATWIDADTFTSVEYPKVDVGVPYSFYKQVWQTIDSGFYPTRKIGNTSYDNLQHCITYGRDSVFEYSKTEPVIFRFFVDKFGVCQSITIQSKQSCYCLDIMYHSAKFEFEHLRFKPAMLNGNYINSYIDIYYYPWVHTQIEYDNLKKFYENY